MNHLAFFKLMIYRSFNQSIDFAQVSDCDALTTAGLGVCREDDIRSVGCGWPYASAASQSHLVPWHSDHPLIHSICSILSVLVVRVAASLLLLVCRADKPCSCHLRGSRAGSGTSHPYAILGMNGERPWAWALVVMVLMMMMVVRCGTERVQHVHRVMTGVLIQQALLLLVALLPQERIDTEAACCPFLWIGEIYNLVSALFYSLVGAVDHGALGTARGVDAGLWGRLVIILLLTCII